MLMAPRGEQADVGAGDGMTAHRTSWALSPKVAAERRRESGCTPRGPFQDVTNGGRPRRPVRSNPLVRVAEAEPDRAGDTEPPELYLARR